MNSLKLLILATAFIPAIVLGEDDESRSDFPTFDRVGYVLVCMDSHGGKSVETLTACSCRIDHIASQMSFAEYEEASTYLRYKGMPGEKGGIFREMERGEELVEKLNAARQEANKACPIVRRSPDSRE